MGALIVELALVEASIVIALVVYVSGLAGRGGELRQKMTELGLREPTRTERRALARRAQFYVVNGGKR